MAWSCAASVVESVPGGVEYVLGGVGDLSVEGIESDGPRALSAPGGVLCGIDANDGDGDKTRGLVLECARRWLVVLRLYYGNW